MLHWQFFFILAISRKQYGVCVSAYQTPRFYFGKRPSSFDKSRQLTVKCASERDGERERVLFNARKYTKIVWLDYNLRCDKAHRNWLNLRILEDSATNAFSRCQLHEFNVMSVCSRHNNSTCSRANIRMIISLFIHIIRRVKCELKYDCDQIGLMAAKLFSILRLVCNGSMGFVWFFINLLRAHAQHIHTIINFLCEHMIQLRWRLCATQSDLNVCNESCAIHVFN